MPSIGYDGSSSGEYKRKHNPLANWMGSGANQVSSSLNMRFSDFPSNYNNLPDVSFVIPDECGDGHDVCPPINNRTRQYDTWIQTHLEAYRQYCSNPANNSLLIVTYDEDDFTPTNRITTVFYGAHVLVGTYSHGINHYNVLRTIEDAMGLTTHAGSAATNSPITYCWTNTSARTRATTISKENPDTLLDIVVHPNPVVVDNFYLKFKSTLAGKISIRIFSPNGSTAFETNRTLVPNENTMTFNRNELNLRRGIYFLEITTSKNTYQKTLIVED